LILTRSGYDLVPKHNATWRLSKTLARKIEFRPTEVDDVKYAWAAYKAGAFGPLLPKDLTADAFRPAFENAIVGRFDALWTFLAETKKGFVPVGLALGFWPHPEVQRFMVIDALVWFPWASPRNRVESATNFVSKTRSELALMAFVRQENKEFLEVLARHGIVRRVGTSHVVFAGEPATVWETRI
jgi:hypothetical protein